MNKEALAAGQELKQVFLKKAIEEGVYLKRPRNTSPDQWSKQRKIGFRYAFQDTTLEELGREYGGTRQNTRLLNHHFLNNIHENSPPELQVQYPRETIPDRKPLGPKSRERFSAARDRLNPKVQRVKELIGKGITDPEQIKDILTMSDDDLVGPRIILKRMGINVPRTFKSRKETFERIEKENDDKKLQEGLNSFSVSSLRHFLHRDSNHDTLTTASAIAHEQGLHAHTRLVRFIADTIEKAEIPIRRIERLRKNGRLFSSYYVVYTKHSSRIAEALRNDPSLQRFR